MIDVIPFDSAHLSAFVNRDLRVSSDNTIITPDMGPSWTITNSDSVIGCAGVLTRMPKGMGAVWMSLSSDVAKHGVWLTRIVRRALRDVSLVYGIKQLETVVLVDNKRNQRWIESLGFKREETYVRYILHPKE